MTKKSAILYFKDDLVNRPILSHLIRDHLVDVNILKASITPDEDGTMFIQVDGDDEGVEGAFAFLEKEGVRVLFPTKNLIWDDEKCTQCGICVGQCLPKAFSTSSNDGSISFDAEKCIACELCIPACPYGALKSLTEHLGV